MNSLKVGHAVFLTGGTIALYLLVRRLAHSRQKCPAQDSPREPAQQTAGVSLRQVYPPPEKDILTDIDIIAIHGLDTKSPDTWIWNPKGVDVSKEACVNWLEDQHMLPTRAARCRIFTCNWPAPLLERSDLVQKRIVEFARLLLDGIVNRSSATNERPIVFIASCLGGVILIQALVIASDEYLPVRRATRGIVFLATPFQGTSFQDVANWAEPALRVWALIRRKKVTKQLDHVKEFTFDLAEIVSRFTQLCTDKEYPYEVSTFYEMGYTDLYSKIFPWLPFSLQSKQLVDRTSATLQMVPHPVPFDRPHVTMNKFSGPDDAEYNSVAGRIESILRIIRDGRPIDKADAWIRKNHYTKEKLQIVRLSGDRLSMDQCYINLAIVEQRGEKDSPLGERDAQRPSPFSRATRLKVATPDKDIQVELPTLFDPRPGLDGRMTEPRRILIRGRAGVGKTTLCKKMVYDFIYHDIWKDLFHRILWVPLRNLKRELKEGYTLEGLFLEEYFSQDPKGKSLAHDLWVALDTIKYVKTLFVLDGLDEVSEGLDDNSKMLKLLQRLLTLPAVIVTSRPQASLPHWLKGKFDIELETIGFHPDQVKTYVEKTFTNPEVAGDIHSFLQHHQLVQDLVRIPIQLDALCFIWSDRGSVSHSGPELQTMTAVYQAIEYGLWKKDVMNLEKTHEGKPLSPCHIKNVEMDVIEELVQDEICLIEGLAFTGLHNDAIEFGQEHQNAIAQLFRPPTSNILLDKTLPHLSFLRTSDPLSKDRNYHFLHLTFQEYFAARYFVRQWKAGQTLKCLTLSNRKHSHIEPVNFLQKHKYNARYDIMWRFVTGLLDAEDGTETLPFFQKVEEEPHDLLGPVHQRLIMHCFSEVALPQSKLLLKNLREKMEHRCQQWSIYEYELLQRMHLCCESEFPDKVLIEMLTNGSNNERTAILQALQDRPQLSGSVLGEIAALLEDDTDQKVNGAAIQVLARQPSLPDNILQALVSRLEDTGQHVRRSVVEALGKQPSLPDNILQVLVSRLEHTAWHVRRSTLEALREQPSLLNNILQALVSRLKDTDYHARWSTLEALREQPSLQDSIYQALVSQLEDTNWYVRRSMVKALEKQPLLPDNILQALVSQLDDTDWDVRRSIVKALGKQPSLPDNILQALVSQLEDTNWDVRWSVVKALEKQPLLPDNILQTLVSQLKDTNLPVRRSVVEALVKQPLLPDHILRALVLQLDHTDWYIRSSAVKALEKQPLLPDNILQALILQLEDTDWDIRRSTVEALMSRLKHTDWHVRRSTVKALGEQPSLPDSILEAIVFQLADTDQLVRSSAVKALEKRFSLPDIILQTLVLQLKGTDWVIRRSAVKVLGEQLLLPNHVLRALMLQLEDTDQLVRWSVVEVLGKQPSLPDNILQALVLRLEDTDWDIRRSAVKALGKQPSLLDNILQAIVSRLEDTDQLIKSSVVEALGKQPSLPDNILQALVLQLEDTNQDIRSSVVKALGKQPSLPNNILQTLVSRLEHTNQLVRWSVVKVLRKQPLLPDNILQALVSRLEDTDWDVRSSAVKALGKQSSLPDNILQALVSQLEDTNQHVRGSVVEALGKQPLLPDNILQALVSQLEHTDWHVRRSAVEALDSDHVYSILPCLNTHTLQILYRSWVRKSIMEQFSCYIQDGILYIETLNRRREIRLLQRKDDILKVFVTEATAMGIFGS